MGGIVAGLIGYSGMAQESIGLAGGAEGVLLAQSGADEVRVRMLMAQQ